MPDSPTSPPSRVYRVLGIVGGAIVAIVLAWIFLRKPIQWSTWIHDLRTDREARKGLRAEPDPALIPKLEAALSDTDLPREVRLLVGALLIEKESRASVEKALTASSLDTRTVAIEVLSREPFFVTQYADDPLYRIHETILEWLKTEARDDRASVIAILPVIHPYSGKLPDDLRAAVRAMAFSPKSSPTCRHYAAASLAGYRDCDSAHAILELAGKETDADAKLRLMQVVVQMWESGGEDCRAKLADDEVKAVVVHGLAHKAENDDNNDANRAVRIGALALFARHIEWAKENLDAIRASLDPKRHEVERRQALETLVAAGDTKTLGRFPAFFHDDKAGVRSSASTAASQDRGDGRLLLSQHALNALVAGYFSAETDVRAYEAPLRNAYSTIRVRAGVWVGLPEPFRTKGGSMSEVAEVVHKLLATGSFEGVTRAQVAEALFRWLATDEGLAAADIDAAVKKRGEFWQRVLAGDVNGAKAVYDAAVGAKPDLWIYERGWLLAKGAL